MLKLSQIMNEGLISKTVLRHKTGEKRLEERDNIDLFENVDIGTGVYWSDRNLYIGGDEEFKYNDIKDKDLKGWRLPNTNDIRELKELCVNVALIDLDDENDTFILKFKNGNELVFPQAHERDRYHIWQNTYLMERTTSVKHENEGSLLLFFGQQQGNTLYRTIIENEMNDNKPHYVRLVKDK